MDVRLVCVCGGGGGRRRERGLNFLCLQEMRLAAVSTKGGGGGRKGHRESGTLLLSNFLSKLIRCEKLNARWVGS